MGVVDISSLSQYKTKDRYAELCLCVEWTPTRAMTCTAIMCIHALYGDYFGPVWTLLVSDKLICRAYLLFSAQC